MEKDILAETCYRFYCGWGLLKQNAVCRQRSVITVSYSISVITAFWVMMCHVDLTKISAEFFYCGSKC